MVVCRCQRCHLRHYQRYRPDDFIKAALDQRYQTCDLFDAMAGDGVKPVSVKVDGGMVANDFFVQRLSDLLDLPVDRPVVTETTAFGAAMLTALADGALQGWMTETERI